jgi:DNA polymerase-3 subunit alpha
VQDFIQAARKRAIPVGPGRGSAAGSVVAYSLGITNVEPLRFDLLFERFLNPERISMPDIDVDFCFERRGEVIEYVRERYGHDSVGQIITFGTLKARASVKDVARVLKMPPSEADSITKLIPSGPAYSMSVAEAADKVPELLDLKKNNPNVARMLALSERIEGLSRHASVHAAGVVIAPGPLDDYVPVCTAPQRSSSNGDVEREAIITQYDMNALEAAGMLKIDFLGLKTLTVIHDACKMIQDRHGVDVDFDALNLDDSTTYEMLRAGRTAGVFQFESALGTDMLYQLRADRFDDLVATNALVRPGPLDSGMHLRYIRRKRGEEDVSYPHPAARCCNPPTASFSIKSR